MLFLKASNETVSVTHGVNTQFASLAIDEGLGSRGTLTLISTMDNYWLNAMRTFFTPELEVS